MKKTCVVILTYNNSSDTLNCIRSVLEFNSAPVKFIVIDNGSDREERKTELKEGLSGLFGIDLTIMNDADCEASGRLGTATLLLSSTNDGYASGNNKGLRLTFRDEEIDNVLILNNDTLFVEDIIPTLRKDLDDTPDAAIVSPVLYKRDGVQFDRNCARRTVSVNELILINFPYPPDPFGIARKKQIPIPETRGLHRIEMPSGSCMMVRKSFFESIDGFDPNTFLYYEENILAEKAKNAGFGIYLDSGIRCIHLGAVSTKKTQSRFAVGCSLQSVQYFVNEYKNPNAMQKAFLKLFCRLTDCRLTLTDKIKKRVKGNSLHTK